MRFMTWIEWVMVAVIVVILAAILSVGIRDAKRPTFELKKDDWRCARSHEESMTIYQNMGSGNNIMLMPITTYSTVCDEWARR